MSFPLFSKLPLWLIIVSAVAASKATGAIVFYSSYRFWRTAQNPSEETVKITPAVNAVTALGRLEPQSEVIHLSPPISFDSLEANRVAQLLVKQGDRVRAGQIIAIFDRCDPADIF